jgi:hypothetical protein
VEVRDFSHHHNVWTSSGAHLASCEMVSGTLLLGIKQQGHEEGQFCIVPILRMHGAVPPVPSLSMAWFLISIETSYLLTSLSELASFFPFPMPPKRKT